MTKFKKLILGLGSLGAVAAPIASVVSCGAEMAMNADKDHEGEGVAFDRGSNTVSFNLCERTSVAPFESFMQFQGGKFNAGVPTLKIAQLFEQSAGYSIDEQYSRINPNAVANIKEGERVKVEMAVHREVWEEANDLHAFPIKKLVPFKLQFSFPFHKIGNMKYHEAPKTKADIGDVSIEKLTNEHLAFYTYKKPYSLHTNFLKALLVAFSRGFTSDGINQQWSTDNSQSITDNRDPNIKGPVKTWKRSLNLDVSGATMNKIYKQWNGRMLKLEDWQVN